TDDGSFGLDAFGFRKIQCSRVSAPVLKLALHEGDVSFGWHSAFSPPVTRPDSVSGNSPPATISLGGASQENSSFQSSTRTASCPARMLPLAPVEENDQSVIDQSKARKSWR